MFGTWVLGSLYVEHVLGYGAWATGLAFLPMTLIVGALSLGTTARVMARSGRSARCVAGLALVVVALTAAHHRAAPTRGYFPTLFVPFALMGLGMGTAMLPLLTIAMSGVPDGGRRPRQSGIVNVSMQLAGALGIAILGTLAQRPHRRARRRRRERRSARSPAATTWRSRSPPAAVIVGIAIAPRGAADAARARAAPGSEVAVEV